MKKYMGKVIFFLGILWVVSASGKAFTIADAYDYSPEKQYTCEKDEVSKTCTLIGFECETEAEVISIPKEYEGYTVTKVAAGIFSEVKGVKEVIVFGNPEFLEEDNVSLFLNPADITFYYEAGAQAEKVFQKLGGKLIPISTVSGVKAKKRTNLQSATVSWNAYSDNAEYYIMTKTAKGYQLSGKTKSTSFVINKLKAGTKQEFAVAVVIQTAIGKYKLLSNVSNPAGVTLKPERVKKFKASAGRGKIKISWAKGKNISGYQIQRKVHIHLKGFKPKFSHLKTVKGAKKTSITNVMLVSGMKYSYRIRNYKTVGKTKVYSDWVTINKKRAR